MHAAVPFEEYVDEVRIRVCGRCPERVAVHAPFAPTCWRCGVKFQLPDLVEAVHQADDMPPQSARAQAHRVVCALCPRLGGPTCPCPVASLAARLVEAVRMVDERHEQFDLLHRRLALGARQQRIPVERMIRAYEEATGACVCCD
jgi:hypothetical protein